LGATIRAHLRELWKSKSCAWRNSTSPRGLSLHERRLQLLFWQNARMTRADDSGRGKAGQ
ncbi:MAG TPA: hypothetical protein VKP30_31380, partial [Polyangiaceae bacterium]|nr:hypothetical protein [Polyangiaceae bacterium]